MGEKESERTFQEQEEILDYLAKIDLKHQIQRVFLLYMVQRGFVEDRIDTQKDMFREADSSNCGIIRTSDLQNGFDLWKTAQHLEVDEIMEKVGKEPGIRYSDWIVHTTNWQLIFEETPILSLTFTYFD